MSKYKGYIVLAKGEKRNRIIGITHSDFLKLKREKIVELKANEIHNRGGYNYFVKSGLYYQLKSLFFKKHKVEDMVLIYVSQGGFYHDTKNKILKFNKEFEFGFYAIETAIYDALHNRKKGEKIL